HYSDPFFQKSRPVDGVELDPLFAGKDLAGIAARYYRGLGMEVEPVLERSDLYQRPGKSPHAFCMDIDRAGDVRILANLKDNAKWMGTLLHELGHAVYDLNIDSSLPFMLRKYPHYSLTEASAMFFESMLTEPEWLNSHLGAGIEEDQGRKLTISRNAQKLIFARWCQIMVRFERELYRNPRQDLDSLWWEMAGKYQLVRIPAARSLPDWASKIHFVTSPVYYHNYLLGELIASQLRHYIRADVDGDMMENGQKISEYLTSNIYSRGNLLRWDKLMERATGERVNPDYLARELKEI
ncbi:MAG: peptidase M3, partial [Candidatus Latescibacteria bacterium]|nr:peptidase M3 [bacterium]MBD3423922.1 peptidase M3 [Candidatus Latescibacterota bacterium]